MKKCSYCRTENKDESFRCKNEDCLSILPQNQTDEKHYLTSVSLEITQTILDWSSGFTTDLMKRLEPNIEQEDQMALSYNIQSEAICYFYFLFSLKLIPVLSKDRYKIVQDRISDILSKTIVEFFFKGAEDAKEQFACSFKEGFAPTMLEYFNMGKAINAKNEFVTAVTWFAHRLSKKVNIDMDLKNLTVIVLDLVMKRIDPKITESLIQKCN